MKFNFFIDLECDANYQYGLPYYAAGIVVEDTRKDGVSSPSGKDLVVSYLDPWGHAHLQCWRATDEVRLIEATLDDYAYLRSAIESDKET